MKPILKKKNVALLILFSIFLFSTATQANLKMSGLEDSEIQIKAPLLIESLNTNKSNTFLSSVTKKSTRTIKSSTAPTQLDYLTQSPNWQSFIKLKTTCSTSLVRTGCDSSFQTKSSFKSSTSLIKIEPKQKALVTIDFHDDSAKNAWAQYEIVLPYESPIDNKTVTGVITVTKDNTASYVNNLPYAVYAYAIVYDNLGSGITITATVDTKK
jgi:hypothetical protein